MKVLVLGGDGYLGWPTAMSLAVAGYEVAIVDNMVKRFWEAESGVEPLFPISTLQTRVNTFERITGNKIKLYIGDISSNHRFVYTTFEDFLPDAVVHYAEQPSAPFSMMNRETCYETQRNNVLGNINVMYAIKKYVPDCHIVKLGTMGEYGTPNIDIEEGWLNVTHNNRNDRVLYPKKPHSFYHLTKVHDSHNLEFGCRNWGLKVTDLNQGVVYGFSTPETDLDSKLATSFHYDHIFGTVLNRFIVQAILGVPLTIYGEGTQTRPALNINDTISCIKLALSNPANSGEFRVFNQFTESFKVKNLAETVVQAAKQQGIQSSIKNIQNPRTELMDHYYNAKNTSLLDLGLSPTYLSADLVSTMIKDCLPFRDRVNSDVIQPTIKWSI